MPIETETHTVIKYTLKEEQGKDGYSSKVEETEDANFIVTNTKPDDPPAPEKPDPISGFVQTGDGVSLLGIAVACIVATLGLCAGISHSRRKRKRLHVK